MLKCDFKSISTSKLGNSEVENEDNKLEPSKTEIESEILVRFAISDGATESSFAKEWSDLLVSCYKDKSFENEHLPITLKNISETWLAITNSFELPWYAQQKAEMGAFATFLGLTINREKQTFETVAIGDCTLFQIRKNNLILSFPIKTIEEFSNTPNLLASNQKHQSDFNKIVVYDRGYIEPNDIIILASDALAAWIFKQIDNKKKPWKELPKNIDKGKVHFEDWLNKKRKANEIKNDDVTLLIINFKK